MNVIEIMEEIKRLPKDDKNKLVDFMRLESRYADDETVRAAGEKVFSEHADLFKKLAQ